MDLYNNNYTLLVETSIRSQKVLYNKRNGKRRQRFSQRNAVDQGDNQSGRFQSLTTKPVTERDKATEKEKRKETLKDSRKSTNQASE